MVSYTGLVLGTIFGSGVPRAFARIAEGPCSCDIFDTFDTFDIFNTFGTFGPKGPAEPWEPQGTLWDPMAMGPRCDAGVREAQLTLVK